MKGDRGNDGIPGESGPRGQYHYLISKWKFVSKVYHINNFIASLEILWMALFSWVPIFVD